MTEEPDILGALIDHELAIKRLYETFAAMSVDRQDFWQTLARDEQRHADQLAGLRSEESVAGWLLRDGGVRIQSIRSSIAYVESQIERAQGDGVSAILALTIAGDLEDALIEEQLSRIGTSGCAVLGTVLERLATETEQHRKTLLAALEIERRSL
ncbi:MAG: hypothetical protein JXA87_00150 [Thermoleophilia bacterium]|nr:hypothetical protein [Thermoleophilia bacterium]